MMPPLLLPFLTPVKGQRATRLRIACMTSRGTMTMRQVIPQTAPDYDASRLFERPDGFYWKAKGETREYGPFGTLLAAVQDMQGLDGEGPEPWATVEQAEADLGIADWIDPETGEPAEEGGVHVEHE
jgi:hypothetical protein